MGKASSIFLIPALIALISSGVGNFFYDLALNPTSNKGIVTSAATNQVSVDDVLLNDLKDSAMSNDEWFASVSVQDRYLKSFDSLKLHSYVIENSNPSNKWVIAVHGYTSKGRDMVGFARKFYDMGYNVILPDLRGHGMSEGDYIGMGWPDRFDIITWINYINSNYENTKIVMHGVSMGGATVMMTSGEELPSNVVAIVEDCGYSSVKAEFEHQLKSIFNLPSYPILVWANTTTFFKTGYTFAEADSVAQVAKSKTPILFIHGDEDTFVPFSMLDEVYEAANCEKEKLVVNGAGHAMSSATAGDVYWDTVFNFINKYM